MKHLIWLVIGMAAFSACSPRAYSPQRTFEASALRSDFELMRKGLETSHPGLYWYTPKPRLDSAFDATAARLDYPLTELEFRKLLDPLVELIHCGHTTVRGSRGFEHWRKRHKPQDFPLTVFEHKGKIFVASNFSDEPGIRKGQEVVRIDGHDALSVYESLKGIVISDGYNQTFKTTTILNNFPTYYRYWYGEKERYEVVVVDSLHEEQTFRLRWKKEQKAAKAVTPAAVTPVPGQIRPPATVPVVRSLGNRNIHLAFSPADSSIAILDINTFGDGSYRKWYRRVFREIERKKVTHLVIDLRNNGGGKVAASNLLMRYVMDQPFQAYQSVESLPYPSPMTRYISERIGRDIMIAMIARKLPEGRRAIRSATRIQKPVKKYGFRGDVYLLTNGGSFSASSITAANLQFWKRAVVVGRETGGGRNGCSAWSIPYLTLPQTRVRVRLPLFKTLTAVTDPNVGHGVIPDHQVVFTAQDIMGNQDPDLQRIYELVRGSRVVKD
ncbi:MAG: hypothetical protein J7576_03095 [Siphonobacter aquaeclarae]|nr:hypothetical protein [Siphonobacter aquaeclarae]